MSRRKIKYRKEALADVNMTNLIDIVMVLLIVFILVSNFIQTGLNIQLPEVQYVETTGKQKIVIGVNAAGEFSLNGDPVSLSELTPSLEGLKQEMPDEGVFIKLDKNALVDSAFKAIASAKQAGFTQVNLPAKLLSTGS